MEREDSAIMSESLWRKLNKKAEKRKAAVLAREAEAETITRLLHDRRPHYGKYSVHGMKHGKHSLSLMKRRYGG